MTLTDTPPPLHRACAGGTCLSSDTGAVVDSTTCIRQSRYKRTAPFITPNSTIQNAIDIPVINTVIHVAPYTTTTAPTLGLQCTPTTSIGLLLTPSNVYVLIKFMSVHLRPELSRRRPQMAGGLWIQMV